MRTQIGITVVWLLVISAAIAVSCSPLVPARTSPEPYLPSLSREEAGDAAPVEVAQVLLERWLHHYRTGDVGWNDRLANYEIEKVELVSQQGDQFVVTLSFSVKPALRDSGWIAGNGLISGTGWIEGKFLFVTIERDSQTYRVVGMGTGP